MAYLLSDFDYHLPIELIAQQPVWPRDHSRLLLLNKTSGEIKHHVFLELIEELRAGDVLVLNNSRVFPARLLGHKTESGGAVEIFLHRKLKIKNKHDIWECLIGGRVRVGTCIEFKSLKNQKIKLRAEVISNNNDGTWQVSFEKHGKQFFKIINQIGIIPLPPYIKRPKQQATDKDNYQTVFSNKRHLGSVAAPTAGLHFTRRMINEIKARGVKVVRVTLHVGLGTFATVKVDVLKNHQMHREFVVVNATTICQVLAAKKEGRRVIAVGTTSCRALESLNWSKLAKDSKLLTQKFWTDIFILPGYRFQVVDALITNFHLPKSTLLMLVSALAGKQLINKAYCEAITARYRFFSYGDAMFIY